METNKRYRNGYSNIGMLLNNLLEIDIMDTCMHDSKFVPPIIIKRYIDDTGSVFHDEHSA